MAVFYGTKISPHITSLTDGGYLLCSSVPIARTGSQLYLPSEIDFEGAEELRRKDGLIEVFREPEEAFPKGRWPPLRGSRSRTVTRWIQSTQTTTPSIRKAR